MTTPEARLIALERRVATLERTIEQLRKPDNWLERIEGSFRGDPVFAKMVEYGREIRNADRPTQDSDNLI